MKTIKQTLMVMTLLVLCGCNPFGGVAFTGTPEWTYMPGDEYPEEYKLGWKHGLESGLSVYGNTLYKASYSYRQDIDMMKNATYSKAWVDAFNYGRAISNKSLVEGMWWSEGFKPNSAYNPLGSGDTRDPKTVHEDLGLEFSIFQGLNTPGWGEHTWHDTDEVGDWLGRSDSESRDWLGRTPAYQ